METKVKNILVTLSTKRSNVKTIGVKTLSIIKNNKFSARKKRHHLFLIRQRFKGYRCDN